jgi:hypothetical protein
MTGFPRANPFEAHASTVLFVAARCRHTKPCDLILPMRRACGLGFLPRLPQQFAGGGLNGKKRRANRPYPQRAPITWRQGRSLPHGGRSGILSPELAGHACWSNHAWPKAMQRGSASAGAVGVGHQLLAACSTSPLTDTRHLAVSLDSPRAAGWDIRAVLLINRARLQHVTSADRLASAGYGVTESEGRTCRAPAGAGAA